jgi:hypothetical protein
MKAAILVGCLSLGLMGCASQRGGTETVYDREYGSGWSSEPVYYGPFNSIYPVRRQPSIMGEDAGGVRPLLNPTSDWYPDHRTAPRHETTVYRVETSDNQPRAYSGRDPIFNP